jgi:hypothetical protein
LLDARRIAAASALYHDGPNRAPARPGLERRSRASFRLYSICAGKLDPSLTKPADRSGFCHEGSLAMLNGQGREPQSRKIEDARDLQAKLYREIGISAVAAALRFTTQPDSIIRPTVPATRRGPLAA